MWLEVHVRRDDYHARLGSRVASAHDAQSRILEYLADDYDITGVKVDDVAWIRDSSKSGWGPKPIRDTVSASERRAQEFYRTHFTVIDVNK